ncbi:TetR/AcrR family transcriptional regulator [Mycobacterium sp. MYCO198283]|uniref:TetR/AcrR family transcriptional regulator n=1 Tax=Mycobacterium sp. MYCO198283 TaxID=2883505 RepID=UPI001E564F58|nr:TetR/AcrR family transcriptional regulator [Mycobacterium sp. MYCO198283]MCG5434187.1 TetR/AcrR family transcriptional regulator [Mycobacterium sp. MYCO198283]
MTAARPYAALLAKGEDRKQRILEAAQRQLSQHGWRNTTLAQIAREAGVSPAGLLHHFESKEQLLHAVLDARDAADAASAGRSGDLLTEIERVAERIAKAPDLGGTFTVLLVENITPDAPLHDRYAQRYRAAVGIVAKAIEHHQRQGRFRSDVDPCVKAVEILAFINGVETTWLLDRTLPLRAVFGAYTAALRRDLAPDPA